MTSPGPWAPPGGGEPDALRGLARVVPLALVVTVLSSAARVAVVPTYVPALPASVAGGLALVALLAGAVAFAALRRPAALWPTALAAPLVLVALAAAIPVEDDRSLHVVETSLRAMGGELLWAATIDAVVVWLWAAGPRRDVATLPAFVALFALKNELVEIGLQLLLPGLALAMVCALFEVVVARGGSVADALRALGRAPMAALVSLGGWVASAVFANVLFVAFAGVPAAEAFGIAIVDPMSLPYVARAAGEIGGMALWGLSLAVAGVILDQSSGSSTPLTR